MKPDELETLLRQLVAEQQPQLPLEMIPKDDKGELIEAKDLKAGDLFVMPERGKMVYMTFSKWTGDFLALPNGYVFGLNCHGSVVQLQPGSVVKRAGMDQMVRNFVKRAAYFMSKKMDHEAPPGV